LGGQYIAVNVADQPTNKLVMIGTLQEGYIGQGGIWPLDDCYPSPSVVDITGRNPLGLLKNNPIWLNSSDSKVNCAIEFNGLNQSAKINDNYALNIENDITLMAWIKPMEENYIIDSLNFSQHFGFSPCVIHINNSIYAQVSEEKAGNGILSTFMIFNNGQLSETNYNESFGNAKEQNELKPVLINMTDYVYVCAYNNKVGNDNLIQLDTYNIDGDDGSITFLDGSMVLADSNIGDKNKPSVIKISDSIIGIAYTTTSGAGMLRTINIDSYGVLIGEIDNHSFDPTMCDNPYIIHVNDSIYAIAYTGPGNDGWIKTIDITVMGIITDTNEELIFDNTECYDPCLISINENIIAVAYRGTDTNGTIKTISILVDGTLIDLNEILIFETDICHEPDLKHFNEDTFIVVYALSDDKQQAGDGFLNTIDILDNGKILGTKMNRYIFHNADGNKRATGAKILQITENMFAISAYGKVGPGNPHPGFIKTVIIGKNIFPPYIRGVTKPESYAIYCNYTSINGYINGFKVDHDININSPTWFHVALTVLRGFMLL